MKYFPDSALVQLEFEKVKALLHAYCQTQYAKEKALDLRIHTQRQYIELELQQTHEFKSLLQQGQHFPNDYVLNLSKELKLLGDSGRSAEWGTVYSDQKTHREHISNISLVRS